MIVFDVIPVGKPRMTQRDKWMSRPATLQYWAYKEELNLKANVKRFTLGVVVDLIFVLPMPDSWSEKKKKEMNGVSHQQKPDRDNLEKAFFDALTDDDSKVWHGSSQKYWGEKGAIVVLRNDTRLGHFKLDDADFRVSRSLQDRKDLLDNNLRLQYYK